MNTLEVLPTLAEIALGVIGFSGIIVVLGRHEGALTELEKFRIGQLLTPSIAAFLVSLLPFVLHETGMTAFTVWRTASAVAAAVSIGWILRTSVRSLYFKDRVPGLFHWPTFLSIFAAHGLNGVFQVLNALEAFGDPNPGIFLFGIFIFLMHAIVQFTRLLFFQFHLDEVERSGEH